ncbi:MAG: hypothetical protein QXQ03_04760 [Candidatus Nezhaarchaeales archaeon]
MKWTLLTALVVISVVAGTSIAILALDVGLRGVVSVPYKVFDIDIVVDRESGMASYDLGKIEVPNGSIIAKTALLEREGNFSIVVNGVLTLKSDNKAYVIEMPCMIVISTSCYRIMAIIPGWDAPMPIEEGMYEVSLKLTWNKASGSGKFYAKLYLVHMQKDKS